MERRVTHQAEAVAGTGDPVLVIHRAVAAVSTE
jgi:hypothetical protein